MLNRDIEKHEIDMSGWYAVFSAGSSVREPYAFFKSIESANLCGYFEPNWLILPIKRNSQDTLLKMYASEAQWYIDASDQELKERNDTRADTLRRLRLIESNLIENGFEF